GEVLTNGTNTADQGSSYPQFPQVGTSINVWAIDGPSVTGDYLINNAYDSGLSPILPAGYTLKRLISSWRVNSSGNIINGFWWGTGREREFTYNTPIMGIVINNPGTSAMTTTLETPYGISVRASIVIGGENTGPYYPSSLVGTDMAPSYTAAPYNVGGSQTANKVSNITNTLSQIRCRCGSSASGEYFRLQTDGWTQAF
ncbi:MAG: hypothetical protein LLG93_12285, partial [Deltaproteobacteria bacterium]|nr:hypothetical protein [Deltaproteobacteria bacterium]